MWNEVVSFLSKFRVLFGPWGQFIIKHLQGEWFCCLFNQHLYETCMYEISLIHPELGAVE